MEPEILQPVPQIWLPKSQLERTVYAALVLAGEPVGRQPWRVRVASSRA